MTEDRYYNNTTVIVDETWESQPIKVIKKTAYVPEEGTKEINVWKHYDPTSLHIDIDSVAWQLSNDEARPGQTVTVDNLKKGQPYTTYPLKDSRDNGKPSGDIPTIDSSNGKIIYDASNGYYYDLTTGTTNDPNSPNRDMNNNGIVDEREWEIL